MVSSEQCAKLSNKWKRRMNLELNCSGGGCDSPFERSLKSLKIRQFGIEFWRLSSESELNQEFQKLKNLSPRFSGWTCVFAAHITIRRIFARAADFSVKNLYLQKPYSWRANGNWSNAMVFKQRLCIWYTVCTHSMYVLHWKVSIWKTDSNFCSPKLFFSLFLG